MIANNFTWNTWTMLSVYHWYLCNLRSSVRCKLKRQMINAADRSGLRSAQIAGASTKSRFTDPIMGKHTIAVVWSSQATVSFLKWEIVGPHGALDLEYCSESVGCWACSDDKWVQWCPCSFSSQLHILNTTHFIKGEQFQSWLCQSKKS